MSFNIYRNESLIQVETYEINPIIADTFIGEVRKKWAFLREKGYAGDYPIEVLRHDGTKTKIVEVFRWKSQQFREEAQQDREYLALLQDISTLGKTKPINEIFTEAVRGFNNNFPKIGGVELLKGVCSCLLTIDGIVEKFPMSVKNGIVLMHRSPRMDLDGDGKNEMYLKILMHGGEQGDGDGGGGVDFQTPIGPIRVEQNFDRPNDGIVKSNGIGGTDFPGTAIWRVFWRIQTPIGTVLTDPAQPLIFGPASVYHYPPVGTHFHSPTGPVKLVLASNGQKVGTLTPGELTAFDIIVTKDDEITAHILNTPPKDIFAILFDYTHKASRPI